MFWPFIRVFRPLVGAPPLQVMDFGPRPLQSAHHLAARLRGGRGTNPLSERVTATERGAKPFDATTKALVDADPHAWLALGHLAPTGPVAPFEPSLATIQAEADKVLLVRGPTPRLVQVEIQASRDPALVRRLHQYKALLYHRHGQPVLSVLVLLRPEADGPELIGVLELAGPDRRRYLKFTYTVVQAWEQSPEALLAGGLRTLPLATLAAMASSELPAVVRRIGERVHREAPPDQIGLLRTTTFFLLGLRRDVIEETRRLVQGMRAMRESSTYQAVLDEGRAEGEANGVRRILLRLGTERFGPPDAQTRAVLEAITDVGRLEALAGRLDRTSGWDDLLILP